MTPLLCRISEAADMLAVSPSQVRPAVSLILRPPKGITRCAVYIAWGPRNRVLYVGKSISVMYRIGQHYDKSPWVGDVVRWEIIPVEAGVPMELLEADLIHRHRPPNNKQYPSTQPPWTVPPSG